MAMTLAASVAAAPATAQAATAPIIDLPAMPAAALAPTGWSLSPIQPAAMDEVSRALWWRDTLGVVFGTETNDGGSGKTLGAVHVGGAWRVPLDHDLSVMLRGEMLGEGTEPSGWRTGAACSLQVAPNAIIEASAWWSVPADDDAQPIGPYPSDGSVGSAWLGLSLRF